MRTIKQCFLLLLTALLAGCRQKEGTVKPVVGPVSESVYASGTIKSMDQYQVFPNVTGIIKHIYVNEGDPVKKGQELFSISSETQRLNRENAALAAQYADFNRNSDRLAEAGELIRQAKLKLRNDSALYARQKALWQQQVGTKVELEQRELAYQNSKAALYSAQVRYNDLNRQLRFSSAQAKNNLLISQNDFIVRSDLTGRVYNLLKTKGELVGPQTALAEIGDASHFILEMQIDEYDIFSIKTGQTVLVTLDSYKGRVYKAVVTKIYPIMNERSKTFKVEAEFTEAPARLYPNISFEANIIIRSAAKALLIPRNYLLNDSMVVKSNGDTVLVKTGLKDYQKVEILSGITAEDELRKPKQ